MENQYQQQPFQPKQPLPNATAVLVLGICAIVFSCFFIGLICGIIGLVLAQKGRAMYRENPNLYEGYGQLNAGWIMSIIGVILGGLYVIYALIWGLAIGTAILTNNSLN
ncbi:MAG: CCC motif membrane protein [Flavisolibacter sp.]